MIEAKRILFITNRNIINTCGELRLIKNRAETLYSSFGFSTDFVVFTNKKRNNPEAIHSGGTLKSFEYSLKNPFSYVKAKKGFEYYIKKQINNSSYVAVIISGAALLPILDVVKKEKPEAVMIADCHGAYEELIEFDNPNIIKTLARHQVYKLWKRKERKYLSKFDQIMAVSEGLKKYLIREYSVAPNSIHVIPCANSIEKLDWNSIKELRSSARIKYMIGDDDVLFVYSGGTSKWQCIDETVRMFKRIRENVSKAKLLILSGDKKSIEKYKEESIIVDSLKPNEVKKVLPGADFAFLLRDDFVTNRVAYPNKFLEYVSSGAKIIATPFVEDIAESIDAFKIGYVLRGLAFDDGLCIYLKSQIGLFGNDFEKRDALLHSVSFENRLVFFNNL